MKKKYTLKTTKLKISKKKEEYTTKDASNGELNNYSSI